MRPHIDLWLAARLLGGWHPKAVVAACDNAIHLRTAYRWKRELVALEEVEIAGFTATFAIRRYSPPARVTAWTRAAA